MRFVAGGIVLGWMVGFFGAMVIVGGVWVVSKGICKLIKLIRSATRSTDAARDDSEQTRNR